MTSVQKPTRSTTNSPKNTDGQSKASSNSAPADPMLPAMNGLEGAMLQMASQYTGEPVQDQSAPKGSTTPDKFGKA